MIYADTSRLKKVLRPGACERSGLGGAIDAETSGLLSLSWRTWKPSCRLKAAWTGGMLSQNQWRQVEARGLGNLRNQPPFEFRRIVGGGLPNSTAPTPEFRRQTLPLPGSVALGGDGRIEGFTPMTHDKGQAKAAIEAGFKSSAQAGLEPLALGHIAQGNPLGAPR